MLLEMYIKLDNLYFSAFDFEVKATEILKYILFFCGEKHGQGQMVNYQVEEKF